MRNTLIDNNLNVSGNRNLSKFSKTFSFPPDYQRLNIFNDKKLSKSNYFQKYFISLQCQKEVHIYLFKS